MSAESFLDLVPQRVADSWKRRLSTARDRWAAGERSELIDVYGDLLLAHARHALEGDFTVFRELEALRPWGTPKSSPDSDERRYSRLE